MLVLVNAVIGTITNMAITVIFISHIGGLDRLHLDILPTRSKNNAIFLDEVQQERIPDHAQDQTLDVDPD